MMRLLNHISPPFDFLEQFDTKVWRGAAEKLDTLPFPLKPKDGAAFGDERASQRTRAHPNGFSVRPQPSRRRTDFIDRPNAHPSTPANLGRKGQDVNRSQKPLLGSPRSLSPIEGSNARRTPALTSAPPLPSLLPNPQDRDDANRERPRAAPPPGARRRARSRAPIHR
jgi:hypothetical protein